MEQKDNKFFSQKVMVFRERRLPEASTPVGYAALVETYNLQAPLPIILRAIGEHHKVYIELNWEIRTPRHQPENTLEGHLIFALKYEGVDLAVLKKLFQAIQTSELESIILNKPTGSYSRKIWFLYEWLMNEKLGIENITTSNYVDILDTKLQYAVEGVNSPRQRVRNNLPGTRNFCPLVFKTPIIEDYINQNLSTEANNILGNVSKDIIARTSAFLLLQDSKSSYAIEGESPAHTRIQRWGRAIGEAGKNPLDLDEILRLQKIVIGDSRFIKLGLRTEGGFIGEHEHQTRLPIPEHISAREEDLNRLIQGMIDFYQGTIGKMDPVILATIISFAFVYIHPFVDGNGRIHRYLIHHVLAQSEFSAPGITFPVSSAILERIDEYREVLESYSKKILPLVDWKPTKDMNVEVLNDTGDYYRYYDLTPHVAFLYSCVEKTIKEDLPQEILFLEKYDQFRKSIENLIEMPASYIDLLFNFLKQNNGKLSKRALSKEFEELKKDEVSQIEAIYRNLYN